MTKVSTKKEYSSSGVDWLGDIPSTWNLVPMRSLFRNRKQIVGAEAVKYTLLGLTLNGVKPRDLSLGGKNPRDYDSYQIFEPGELVMCLFDYDVTPRTVGYVMQRGIMTGAYTRLIPRNKLDPRYYFYLFLYFDERKELLHLCTGLRNSISKYVFWSLLNPYPPLEIQKRIADFLDEKTKVVDELIEKKQKLIELLHEKRGVLITHTVTKGLDSNAKLKPSGIDWLGNIPAGWEARKLKYLSHIDTSGIFGDEVVSDVEAKLVTTGQLSMSGEWYWEKMDNRFFTKDEYRKFKNIYGDIVVVKSSGSSTNIISGKAGFVSEKEVGTVFGNFLLRIRALNIINPKFLYYFLTSHLTRQRIELMCSSTTYPNLKVWEYVSALILLPPMNVQKNVVGYLDTETAKMDKAVVLIESQIEKLKEYRSSLIYHAVTGKIKV